MRVALLGLGEAGSRLAADLAGLGVEVAGWDPVRSAPPAVRTAANPVDAVRKADLVLSANSAGAAMEAALAVHSLLEPQAIYADLNTASPRVKENLAELFPPGRALFVDVALMAPVTRDGIRTPCLVSGPGANAYREALGPFGVPITVVDEQPGSASARKLLRSIFTKGMGVAAVEAMATARGLGLEEWLRKELERELEAQGAAHLDRMLEGSRKHARRRVEEMRAAAELGRAAGEVPLVSEAAAQWFEKLAQEESGSSRRALPS